MNRRLLVRCIAGATALAMVLTACGGGDEQSGATVAASAAPDTAASPTSPTTTTPPTTAPVTVPATTAPATTIPATLQPASTVAPVAGLSGEHVEIASDYVLAPFVLDRVGEYGSIKVYDGLSSGDDGLELRCIAIARDGVSGWNEMCELAGYAGSFVFLDGIDPWIVDYGTDVGDVVLAQQPFDWAITSSGCTEPIVNLVAAAAIDPAVVTSIACVENEAFVTYSSVLMQPGPPDGGGMLLINGDEGWNTDGGGTSIGCNEFQDGVDRCQSFGVDYEMFGATSPLPSPELLPPAADFVNVRATTSEMRTLAGDADDLDAVTDAIVTGLTQPDAEVAPTTIRHDGLWYGFLSMLIVEVPLMDDSTRSTTNVVWINSGDDQPLVVHRAYAWDNCARGVTEGLCV